MPIDWGAVGQAAATSAASSAFDFGTGQAAARIGYGRQQTMAQKKIRWAVADMRAAGLNPLLAVSGGVHGGAGAVPGGTGTRTDIGGTAASLAGARRSREEAKSTSALRDASVAAKYASNVRDTAVGEAAWARAKSEQQMRKNLEIDYKVKRLGLYSAARDAASAKAIYEVDRSKLGQWLIKSRHILDRVNPFSGASVTRRRSATPSRSMDQQMIRGNFK